MTLQERKLKMKQLSDFLGEQVQIHLKNMTILNGMDEEQINVSNTVQGYVIDVREYYLYLGKDMTGFGAAIDIDEIGFITIVAELDEIEMNLPDNGERH